VRFPRGVDLDRIASKDKTREHLCQAYYDLSRPGDPRVVATDGHRLVAVKVESEDGDEEGQIPRGAFAAANGAMEEGLPGRLIATDVVRSDEAGVTFDRPPVTEFPDWRANVPARRATVHVTLNPRYLADIAKSIGSKRVTLHMVPDENGNVVDQIVIEPDGATDVKADAILMPVRRDGE